MGVIKNVFYSTISTSSMVFLFFLLVIVGRYLGVDEYGVFTTALSIAMIAEIIADFGLRDLCLRNLARDLDRTSIYIGNLITWKLIVACCVFGTMFIVVYLLGYEANVRFVLYIMVAASVAKSIKYTFRIFLQANGRFDLDAAIESGEKILLFGLGFLVLTIWHDLLLFVITFCSIRVLGLVVIIVTLHFKIAHIRPLANLQFSKKLQMQALPFGLFGVIFVMLSYIDSIMLSRMRSYEEVGLYNAAFRIFEGVSMLPTILFIVMLPRLSKLASSDMSAHKILSNKVIKYMYILALPIFCFCFLYSDYFVLFFGEDFTEASLTLRILIFGILFSFPTWMLNTILISINEQNTMLFIAITGLIGNIILNLIVIPLYGYNGAAFSTVMTEIIMFICLIVYLYKNYNKIPVLKIFCRPFFASAVIFVIGNYINVLSIKALIGVIISLSILYVMLLFAFGTFDRDERAKFNETWKKLLLKFNVY